MMDVIRVITVTWRTAPPPTPPHFDKWRGEQRRGSFHCQCDAAQQSSNVIPPLHSSEWGGG